MCWSIPSRCVSVVGGLEGEEGLRRGGYIHSQQTQRNLGASKGIGKGLSTAASSQFWLFDRHASPVICSRAWRCQLCQPCNRSSCDSRVAQLQQFGVTDPATHFGGAAKSIQAPSAKTRHVLRGRAGMEGTYVTAEDGNIVKYGVVPTYFHISHPLRRPYHFRIIRSDQILVA
jgi:hypothetical protein